MGNLNNRIKKARKNAGLTQQYLAEKIGVSLRTLKNYEKDSTNITVDSVNQIALFCGVDEVWLLTGRSINENEVSPKEIKQYDVAKEFFNPDKANRLIDKLIRLEYISESQLDRVEVEIDRLLEIAEDVVADIKKAEDANWQKDKEQKKEAVMASMGKTQRRKKAAG